MRRRNRVGLPEWTNRPEDTVPLHSDTLNACVRIIGDVPYERIVTGRRRGSIGSGFIITVGSEAVPGMDYGHIVTAAHVIEDQNKIEVQAPDPLANGALFDPVELTEWYTPLENVDIAIAPLKGVPWKPKAISLERQVMPANGSPYLGSEFFYVGVLEPLDRAMARKGIVGAVDQIGIEHDGGWEYPCHLVDCRSYGGFSGSPCFMHTMFPILRETPPRPDDPTMAENRDPIGEMRHHTMLIGMFTEHLADKRSMGVASRYGVGMMLRSREIREALMSDDLKAERRKYDAVNAEAIDEDRPTPTQAGVSVSDENEFDRFESLTKKLVQVPKSELDVERKKREESS